MNPSVDPTSRPAERTATRRHRQLVEIAGLVVGGAGERAEGLALVHVAEFPEDAELLARLTGAPPTARSEDRRRCGR